MNPEVGSLWRRKLSGRLWRVNTVADGLVWATLEHGRTDCTATEKAAETEMFTLDAFLGTFRTCDRCGGTGGVDSGGVTPWGEGITVPCDCDICQCYGPGACEHDDKNWDPADI